jgi:hypothetical protein
MQDRRSTTLDDSSAAPGDRQRCLTCEDKGETTPCPGHVIAVGDPVQQHVAGGVDPPGLVQGPSRGQLSGVVWVSSRAADRDLAVRQARRTRPDRVDITDPQVDQGVWADITASVQGTVSQTRDGRVGVVERPNSRQERMAVGRRRRPAGW